MKMPLPKIPKITRAKNAFSRRDLERELKISRHTAIEWLHEWLFKGWVKFAGYRIVKRVDGKRTQIPLYQLTQKGRKNLIGGKNAGNC